jgi:hypothetical protein
MATGVTQTLANDMLIRASSLALFLSLHNGDPGSTGASELAISPYGRQAPGWSAPASGKLTLGGPVHMAVNANSSIGFYGMWNQKTLGNFLGGSSLSAVEIFAAPGTYTVSSLNFSIPII